jgi:hypothetical protein
MRAVYIYIILFGIIGSSNAQQRQFVGAAVTPGFLLAHRADILHLAAHNYGVEVAYEKEVQNSWWGSYYRKPSVGFSLLYYNLGRVETGHAFGFVSYVKLNLTRIGKSDIRFRMGGGLAYLTQTFDIYKLRRNQTIGSNLNGSMQFGLFGHTPLRKNADYLEYGLSISHYSNAAFKVPNLGYNIPSITLRYGFGFGQTSDIDSIVPYTSKALDWRATAIFGKKQRNFGEPVNFYNYGVQIRGIKNINPVKAWRFGIDYTLDKTYKYSEDKFYPLDSISIIDQSEVAVAAGFQWGFGKTSVIAEMGAYIYKPAVLKNPLSQRMGISYQFNKHLNAQGTLRFHRGVADFFEFGIGYTL